MSRSPCRGERTPRLMVPPSETDSLLVPLQLDQERSTRAVTPKRLLITRCELFCTALLFREDSICRTAFVQMQPR
jgi:hypothetical protein